MKSLFARLVRWIGNTFDVRDAMLAFGLVFLSAGLAQVWVPAAYIVPGAIVTLIAIFGPRLSNPPQREE